jgi:DNA-binding IclR family transcriptional regulator
MGLSVNLSFSAAGHAWLATMSDEKAQASAGSAMFKRRA